MGRRKPKRKNRKPAQTHNYMAKALQVAAQAQKDGKVIPGRYHEIDVLHDKWCLIHEGGFCNCNPIIKKPRLVPAPIDN